MSADMRVRPQPRCFCCGSPGDRLYDGLKDNLFSAPGTWSLKRCPNESCGVVWLDPMPIPEDLSLAYEEYYTHGGGPRRSMPFNLAKNLYRAVVDGFLMIAGIPVERRRAALMFVGDLPCGTILDIGCGQGIFLGAMKRRGWKVAGVDFDIAAVNAARSQGIDVRVGTVDSVVRDGEKFNVVTASHVIEHVPDPIEFLAQCRKLLLPGGKVVVRTPNVGSLGHKRYGRFWRGLESPRHLHLFTSAALEECATRAGFEDAHCFTSSVGAEGILIASHFLEKLGEFRPASLSRLDTVKSKALAPFFALQGKMAWLMDRGSGEELFAVLTNGDPAIAE